MWFWFLDHYFMEFWVFVLSIVGVILLGLIVVILLKIWLNLLETEGS